MTAVRTKDVTVRIYPNGDAPVRTPEIPPNSLIVFSYFHSLPIVTASAATPAIMMLIPPVAFVP